MVWKPSFFILDFRFLIFDYFPIFISKNLNINFLLIFDFVKNRKSSANILFFKINITSSKTNL
ncbi:hypothetical protein EAH81_08140 [Flavobacterium pectinovorum]|uniref:Uncharacterized protein n=1 Tax=Flavobacterium pectinovorum TaxID=29533 RepID=A0A502EWG7_9FLAO|nr:hypothetical protein EAH81_08140 [Flavobacterium pectinovorum]